MLGSEHTESVCHYQKVTCGYSFLDGKSFISFFKSMLFLPSKTPIFTFKQT